MLCYVFVCLIVLTLSVSSYYRDNDTIELNEYDTYNAEECARIRQPWHLMDEEERDLYISGLLALRNNEGKVELDDLAAIASVHVGATRGTIGNYISAIHQSSSNNYWHNYILFELESRIRNLGGKWKCFAMPYYDVTLEHGREQNPFIFTTGLGGDGNVNDHYAVNGYSWNVTIGQYWVPSACLAEHDSIPLCSLKRALRRPVNIPDAQTYGDVIIENKNSADFSRAYWALDNFGGLFNDFPEGEGYQNNMGWYDLFIFATLTIANILYCEREPIWPLYHSFIQYHQSIWTVCHGYDHIPVDELQNYEDAYEPFLDFEDYDDYIALELDEPMLVGGILPHKNWSYVHANELTIRKMYSMPKWNIKYDLLDGTGFYTDSGLREFCGDGLNEDWFILDEGDEISVIAEQHEEEIQTVERANESENEEKVEVALDGEVRSSGYTYWNELLLAIGGVLTALFVALYKLYICKNEQQQQNEEEESKSRPRVRFNGYGSTI